MKIIILTLTFFLSFATLADQPDYAFGGKLVEKGGPVNTTFICMEQVNNKCLQLVFVAKRNQEVLFKKYVNEKQFKKIARNVKKTYKNSALNQLGDNYFSGTALSAFFCLQDGINSDLGRIGCMALIVPLGITVDIVKAPFLAVRDAGKSASLLVRNRAGKYKRWFKFMANPKKKGKEKRVNSRVMASIIYNFKKLP